MPQGAITAPSWQVTRAESCRAPGSGLSLQLTPTTTPQPAQGVRRRRPLSHVHALPGAPLWVGDLPAGRGCPHAPSQWALPGLD